jgi:hypothetical protein
MEGKHGAGKGDNYRKIDYELWSKNYDLIFRKDKKNGKDNHAARSNKRRTSNRKGSK